jgi:hypothetical protein
MKKWTGIFLIFTMFFSSLAFAFLSKVGDTAHIQQAPEPEGLPSDFIISYRLSPLQFNQAMSTGLTVATYRYEKSCLECANQRAILERLALSQEFSGQVILEEIESSGPASLEVNSFLGGRTIDDINQESVISVFCELVANPPLGCVTRQNLTGSGNLH